MKQIIWRDLLLVTSYSTLIMTIYGFVFGTIYANVFFGLFLALVHAVNTVLWFLGLSLIYQLLNKRFHAQNAFVNAVVYGFFLTILCFVVFGIFAFIEYQYMKAVNIYTKNFSLWYLWKNDIGFAFLQGFLVSFAALYVEYRKLRRLNQTVHKHD